MSGPTAGGRRPRRPGRLARAFVAVAIALVVVIAGFAIAEYYRTAPGAGGATLVVYTYSSFFGGNCGVGSANLTDLLDDFDAAHHVTVELYCPAGSLVAALQDPAAYGLPAADLVVGLDEITAPQAAALGLLLPYTPPAAAFVPSWLVGELGPTDDAFPYEYGYLAVDYTSAFGNATGGAVDRATLPELVDNASWAAQLLTENPLYDITGEEFLAWEVEYYTEVLHESWTTFWQTFFAGPHPTPALSWGDAFGEFGTPAGQNSLVVSYATDPAYAAATGDAGAFNATLSWWNGTAYGWRTIYGAAVVAGTREAGLAEALENYLLDPRVQNLVPTNEWEYPANATVVVPPVFRYAVDPTGVVALNNATTPSAVAQNLTGPGGWLSTWQGLAGGG
ncbi:MAG TPA: thiamine ABC transporter substrate-binding protein [Thermoplasmata archaeon]|jgi:thiamine transport system substrate-binding protein|nr:thiamine ABC transporter substrate-binding protein [Thermoplasmata archaeon]